MSEENTVIPPEEKNTADHNKITQQMYDEKASRARKMEGLVADRDARIKALGFQDIEDLENKIIELKAAKDKPKADSNTDIETMIKAAKEKAVEPLLEQIKAANEKAELASKKVYEVTVGTQAINELKATDLFQDDTIDIVKSLYLKDKIQQSEDGSLYVVDNEGEPIYIDGKKKTIADLANELIEKHPSFKKDKSSSNSRPSGGDSSKANTDGGTFNPKAFQAITDKQERIDYIRKNALSGGKK